jgi:hypothetical protein
MAGRVAFASAGSIGDQPLYARLEGKGAAGFKMGRGGGDKQQQFRCAGSIDCDGPRGVRRRMAGRTQQLTARFNKPAAPTGPGTLANW